jgi:hypothetical protein
MFKCVKHEKTTSRLNLRQQAMCHLTKINHCSDNAEHYQQAPKEVLCTWKDAARARIAAIFGKRREHA